MDHSIRGSTPDRVIELNGEWDLTRKDELKRLFEAVPPDKPLTIDVRQVTFADSTFLGVLADLARRLQKVPITLLGARDGLKRVLTITNLDRIFRMVEAE